MRHGTSVVTQSQDWVAGNRSDAIATANIEDGDGTRENLREINLSRQP